MYSHFYYLYFLLSSLYYLFYFCLSYLNNNTNYILSILAMDFSNRITLIQHKDKLK